MRRNYRTIADRIWGEAEDKREAERGKDREREIEKETAARLERPAWGVMKIKGRWFWAAWKVRSADVSCGGFRGTEELAREAAVARVGAAYGDWLTVQAVFAAYETLRAENRIE